MLRKLVVGNWKMNLTPREGVTTIEAFVEAVERCEEVQVAICPPYMTIPRVHPILHGTHIELGAQDCFWLDEGAFTGQVSVKMLSAEDIQFCIVGHSETRGRFGKLDIPESTVGYFAETNETVNLKIKALLTYGIHPILCVGETLAERDAGTTDSTIRAQLEGAMAGIDGSELEGFVVAYEPVWAIGTGQVCPSDEAGRICRFIHDWFRTTYGDDVASLRVLYGGSVKASNAKELFLQEWIDGGLVGGASLVAKEFSQIVDAAWR
jgi:triosephosphate isomerase